MITVDQLNDLPKHLKPVMPGKSYLVQISDNKPNWWGVTLPPPLHWLQSLRIFTQRRMEVVYLQDSRLKFEHVIIAPIHVEPESKG